MSPLRVENSLRISRHFTTKKIGWSDEGAPFNCPDARYDDCLDNIAATFMNETDQFSLIVPDSKDRTLADVFCEKFPDVPEDKLQLGKTYVCIKYDIIGSGSFSTQRMVNVYSKQKLECKQGIAIVTGAGSFLNAQIEMIFSLLGISFAHFNHVIVFDSSQIVAI